MDKYDKQKYGRKQDEVRGQDCLSRDWPTIEGGAPLLHSYRARAVDDGTSLITLPGTQARQPAYRRGLPQSRHEGPRAMAHSSPTAAGTSQHAWARGQDGAAWPSSPERGSRSFSSSSSSSTSSSTPPSSNRALPPAPVPLLASAPPPSSSLPDTVSGAPFLRHVGVLPLHGALALASSGVGVATKFKLGSVLPLRRPPATHSAAVNLRVRLEDLNAADSARYVPSGYEELPTFDEAKAPLVDEMHLFELQDSLDKSSLPVQHRNCSSPFGLFLDFVELAGGAEASPDSLHQLKSSVSFEIFTSTSRCPGSLSPRNSDNAGSDLSGLEIRSESAITALYTKPDLADEALHALRHPRHDHHTPPPSTSLKVDALVSEDSDIDLDRAIWIGVRVSHDAKTSANLPPFQLRLHLSRLSPHISAVSNSSASNLVSMSLSRDLTCRLEPYSASAPSFSLTSALHSSTSFVPSSKRIQWELAPDGYVRVFTPHSHLNSALANFFYGGAFLTSSYVKSTTNFLCAKWEVPNCEPWIIKGIDPNRQVLTTISRVMLPVPRNQKKNKYEALQAFTLINRLQGELGTLNYLPVASMDLQCTIDMVASRFESLTLFFADSQLVDGNIVGVKKNVFDLFCDCNNAFVNAAREGLKLSAADKSRLTNLFWETNALRGVAQQCAKMQFTLLDVSNVFFCTISGHFLLTCTKDGSECELKAGCVTPSVDAIELQCSAQQVSDSATESDIYGTSAVSVAHDFSVMSYVSRLICLLNLEEQTESFELHRYDLLNVSLTSPIDCCLVINPPRRETPSRRETSQPRAPSSGACLSCLHRSSTVGSVTCAFHGRISSWFMPDAASQDPPIPFSAKLFGAESGKDAVDFVKRVVDYVVEMGPYDSVTVKITVKGVGENKPMVNIFDLIEIRSTYQGISTETVAEVVSVNIQTDEITIRLPAPSLDSFSKTTSMMGDGVLPSALLPYFRVFLGVFGVKVELQLREQPPKFVRISEMEFTSGVHYEESSSPRFDVRFGAQSGKGIRAARNNLISFLPDSIKRELIRKVTLAAANPSVVPLVHQARLIDHYHPDISVRAPIHTKESWKKSFVTGEGFRHGMFHHGERCAVYDATFGSSWDSRLTPGRALSDLQRLKMLRRFIAPTHGSVFDKDYSSAKQLPRPKLDKAPSLFNDELNLDQRLCVFDILNRGSGDAPYIIFGPPGTGKTMTLVESILQVVSEPECQKRNAHYGTHIALVCCPSDAACDVIASRLQRHLGNEALLRINHFQRKFASLPPNLIPCSPNEDGTFVIPPPSTLNFKVLRVVVCTCHVSGLLDYEGGSGWPSRKFSHCFIDESCQATEPEVLIPLLSLGEGSTVVLAGDPRQLGPTLSDEIASKEGLKLSLQERLQELPLYSCGKYTVMTMLRNNYRSHHGLLEIPSVLFYDNQLKGHASDDKKFSCEKWELLEGQRSGMEGFEDEKKSELPLTPLLICNSSGVSHENASLDASTPSFFNRSEVDIVCDLVRKLVSSKSITVKAREINVISPFRSQVLRLRTALRKAGYSGVGVGQVEDYQGQESRVVIISTVLTHNEEKYGTSGSSSLGLMRDPKRFNVAMSRAEGLVVVVGHVDYLESTGMYWEALVDFCRRKNLITDKDGRFEGGGKEGGADDDPLDALLRKAETLGFGGEASRLEHIMKGWFYSPDDFQWRVTL